MSCNTVNVLFDVVARWRVFDGDKKLRVAKNFDALSFAIMCIFQVALRIRPLRREEEKRGMRVVAEKVDDKVREREIESRPRPSNRGPLCTHTCSFLSPPVIFLHTLYFLPLPSTDENRHTDGCPNGSRRKKEQSRRPQKEEELGEVKKASAKSRKQI